MSDGEYSVPQSCVIILLLSGGLFSCRVKLVQSTAYLVTAPLRESSDFELLLILHCHRVAHVGSSKGIEQE